jgi:dTDP-N-acetylfucosamine:lipid II N-acetylfucosaminyltransferase
MNLHIVPDNTFINKFYDNLQELGLLSENKIVVRTSSASLSSVKREIFFAPLNSRAFKTYVGDTSHYEKVFIHYFTPLLYRWVALHKFRELNWMIWGGDLYNLPSLDHMCYEPLTLEMYIKKDFSLKKILYETKVWVMHEAFKKSAYTKVSNILTWMHQEYLFALRHLKIHAGHQFFFYENQFPYEKLDAISGRPSDRKGLSLLIGNSGSPTNNHLDIVQFLESHKVEANLLVPVSYGDSRYISFLKKNLRYSYGKLEFVDRYMPFEEYLQFISEADALIMNAIRPQGYGNILMMLYMDKPVYFNEKNVSLPDLTLNGIKWRSIPELPSMIKEREGTSNKAAVIKLLSHDRLLTEYRKFFS